MSFRGRRSLVSTRWQRNVACLGRTSHCQCQWAILSSSWLADYPGLRLKRLDLQVVVCEDTETQAARFDATCESLHLLGRSADILRVTFQLGRFRECHQSVCKIQDTQMSLSFRNNYLCMQTSIIQETMASCQS